MSVNRSSESRFHPTSTFDILLSAVASRAIIPSSLLSKSGLEKSRKNFEGYCNPLLQCEAFTFSSREKVTLSGYKLVHQENLTQSPHKQKWIVSLMPNGEAYEQELHSLQNLALSTRANIMTFNYRNVGHSTSRALCFEDLVDDAIAAVNLLLDKGVSPEHILIKGHSLGGAIATQTAAYFSERNQIVHLCNDRSFSSLSKEVRHVTNRFFEKVAKRLGWDADIESCLPKIKGEVLVIYGKEDGMVPFSNSALKAFEQSLTHFTSVEVDRNSKDWLSLREQLQKQLTDKEEQMAVHNIALEHLTNVNQTQVEFIKRVLHL